jgi:hypothetical protein
MQNTAHTLLSLMVALMLSLPAIAQAQDRFASAASPGFCLTNSGGSATIQGCSASSAGQSISMPYVQAENVFFGQLKINGQCLDAAGATLKFAACANGPAQTWKMSGKTGKINNGADNCVGVRSGSLTTWPCNQGGSGLTWWNSSSAKVFAIPNMKIEVPCTPKGCTPVRITPGTKLSIVNGNIVAGGAGNIIAAKADIVAGGAGNIVAGGAGNIVAGGAGNIVAGGAGN